MGKVIKLSLFLLVVAVCVDHFQNFGKFCSHSSAGRKTHTQKKYFVTSYDVGWLSVFDWSRKDFDMEMC